jgi:hypothetical protein
MKEFSFMLIVNIAVTAFTSGESWLSRFDFDYSPSGGYGICTRCGCCSL